MSNLVPERVTVAGRIFRVGKATVEVCDLISQDLVEIGADSLVMSLGEADRYDSYEFQLLETSQTIRIDDLDAIVLESSSTEIA